MSEAIKKYNDIMRRYHDGEFGNDNLSLHQILTLAGAPTLLENMSPSELQELMRQTESMSFKLAISQMQNLKSRFRENS